MKIVYDMRTGEIIDRSADSHRDAERDGRAIPDSSGPEAVALQLAEYRWSGQTRSTPPVYPAGCFGDGDK